MLAAGRGRSKKKNRKKTQNNKKSTPPKTHQDIHSSPATATTSRRRATRHIPRVSPYTHASIDPGLWKSASYSSRNCLWQKRPRSLRSLGLFFCLTAAQKKEKKNNFFFFERPRPAASMRTPCLIYLSTSTGVRTGCHYLISCRCICV